MTLPPGWTGNDADHHIRVGPFNVSIFRARIYNALARCHQRTGGYRWRVAVGAHTIAESSTLGHPTSAEARKAAVDAIRVSLFEAQQMIDWLKMNPVEHPNSSTPIPPATAGEETT